MLGASLPGYDLEISTDDLYRQDAKMKWPVTGWNEYYDTGGRKYADILTAKKKKKRQVPPNQASVDKLTLQRFLLPNRKDEGREKRRSLSKGNS